MKTLKVMSSTKMYALANGKKSLVIIYLSTLFFLLAGPVCMYLPFYDESESFSTAIVGLLCTSMALLAFYFFLRGETNYVPGKSFKWVRLTKDGQKKLAVWSVVLCGTLSIFTLVCGQWTALCYSIGALIVLYYFIMSLKVHEDVDYVTNQAMEEMLGVDIDERVFASYQNFNNTSKKQCKGNNLLVVTNRKIFYAIYNGNKWMILKRQLEELRKIGFINSISSSSESFLVLEFSDSSSICMKMDILGKLTSNPNLFIKQFLKVLDAYVSGYDIVKSKSRRRVSVTFASDNTIKTEEMNTYTQASNNARKVNIELGEDILAQINAGDEVTSGRRIEL